MKTHQHRAGIIQSDHADPAVPPRATGHRTAALLIALAVALVAVAGWVKPEQAVNQSSSASAPAANPDAASEFVYFPSQYVNQATEPSDHIQAF